jgi:hypothetical protein
MATDERKRQAVDKLVQYGQPEKDCHKIVKANETKAG